MSSLSKFTDNFVADITITRQRFSELEIEEDKLYRIRGVIEKHLQSNKSLKVEELQLIHDLMFGEPPTDFKEDKE